jgi:hypothetical protein
MLPSSSGFLDFLTLEDKAIPSLEMLAISNSVTQQQRNLQGLYPCEAEYVTVGWTDAFKYRPRILLYDHLLTTEYCESTDRVSVLVV